MVTELQLYRFIQDNDIEIEWRGDNSALYIWLHSADIQDFVELINRSDEDDGGLDCKLQNQGYVVLDLIEMCEEHGINPENILAKE